jgi:hypothetical protein
MQALDLGLFADDWPVVFDPIYAAENQIIRFTHVRRLNQPVAAFACGGARRTVRIRPCECFWRAEFPK